jgi:hypothetical protein
MCPGIPKPGEGSQAIPVLDLYIVHHLISQVTSSFGDEIFISMPSNYPEEVSEVGDEKEPFIYR